MGRGDVWGAACAAAVVVRLVVACRAEGVDECKVVLGDPAHAVAEITKLHAGDPAKVADIIERCIAPDGDPCQRIAKIIAKIPAMMPTALPRGDALAICNGMPPQMRSCFLPSYVMAHGDECQRMRDEMLEAIDLNRIPAVRNRCNGGEVVVYIDGRGLWIAPGTGDQCFTARKAGALDRDWLEAELRPLARRACRPAVELAAAPATKYQETIDAMDTAVKVGLVDVELSDPAELQIRFASTTKAAKHCPDLPVSPKADARAAPAPPRSTDKAVLAQAPVVIMTTTEISFAGKHVATPEDLAKLLPPHPASPLLILQADRAVAMGLIVRIVSAAKSAGYTDLLFAVKYK